MNKYILIQNDGEIEANSFELIGASTKRGEKGKIGFFGSGLKYSIAYMMRNNIGFRIFSGNKELKFTTTPETLKGKTFERICIDGKPTSYTTTMGPTWTEDWFVLREIYCNAVDESGVQLIKNTENVQPSEGKTRIYIQLVSNLKAVIENWDRYFSDEREKLFSVDGCYTSYLGTSDIGGRNEQKVCVYPRTEGVAYRRGVRVHTSNRLLFDYEFEYVDINEDRTAKNPNALPYCIADIVGRFPNENYVKTILKSAQDDTMPIEYISLSADRAQNGYSEKWVEFSKRVLLVVKEICGRYEDEINRTRKEVYLIPRYYAADMKKCLPEVEILGMGKSIGNVGITIVDRTKKIDFLIKEVCASLEQMKYYVPYEITVVEFDRDEVLGQADVPQKKIYLSTKLFDTGRREIALCIMEECEHIASGHEDETRAFQSHLFSSWLKSMEDANGLFL